MQFLIVSSVAVALADDQTSVTQDLNDALAAGNNGPYSGGKGLIVRSPDFLVTSDTNMVPATFWSNELFAPTQMYPTKGQPWCPNDGWDGWEKTDFMKCDPNTDVWDYAIVGVVMMEAMDAFFPEFDNIQSDDWGWGVFYASDSNSVDKRCIWRDSYKGWECPGYWIDEASGSVDAQSTQRGPGYYMMGNPYTQDPRTQQWGGGGAGCHFDGDNGFDQQDAWVGNKNIVSDYFCQCNYDFKGSWDDWVSQWIDHTQQKDGVSSRDWLANGGGKAPIWALDTVACWMNNFRDMIGLQNALYWRREEWDNQLIPKSQWDSFRTTDLRHYWGWNEIPVTRDVSENPQSWDAIVIKLPANICDDSYGSKDSLSCLNPDAQRQVEVDIKKWVDEQKLYVGRDFAGQRPGSYIVVVREWGNTWGSTSATAGNLSNGIGGINWQRYFFCENWWGPQGWFNIVFESTGYGICYVEYPGAPTPAPTPPQPPVGLHNIRSQESGNCLDVPGGYVVNGAILATWDCNGLDQQRWQFLDGLLRYWGHADYCVDVPGNTAYNGQFLQLWECSGGPQQQFSYDKYMSTVFLSSVEDAEYCMDLQNGGTNPGTPVQLWDCIGGAMNQAWDYGGVIAELL